MVDDKPESTKSTAVIRLFLPIWVKPMGAIERGEKLPKLKAFINIANALESSSDALLADVLKAGNEVVASDLSNKLSRLSPTDQRRILHVIETMIADSK